MSTCLVGFGVAATPTGIPDTPQPHRTGTFRLVLFERSPLNRLDEVCTRFDIDLNSASLAPSEKAKARQEYSTAAEMLQVFVPTSYRSDTPHGLVVWLGVGAAPETWHLPLQSRKLVLIGAHPTSDKGFARLRLPLDAVHCMSKLYSLDSTRVYVAGYSAGAGLAVHTLCAYPDVFRGGLFLLGGRFCVPLKNELGQFEPTLQRLCPEWKAPLDSIRRDIRMVFLRANGDTLYSPQEDIAQCTSLFLDGFTRVSYLVVPSGGHKPPDAVWFERALIALDSAPKLPLITTPTTDPKPSSGQVAQAQRILATGQWLLKSKVPALYDKQTAQRHRLRAEQKARTHFERVLQDYPTTPAALKARKLLETLEQHRKQ